MISQAEPLSAPATIRLRGDSMCDLGTVRFFTRLDAEKILELIEDNSIQFCFDIRSPKATKAVLRIPAMALAAYLQGFKLPRGERGLEGVISGLWPHSKAELRASEVYRAWTCSPRHLLDLIRDGVFGAVKAARQCGHRVSPKVPRSGVNEFLRKRVWP
jgi:hypothetical protein